MKSFLKGLEDLAGSNITMSLDKDALNKVSDLESVFGKDGIAYHAQLQANRNCNSNKDRTEMVFETLTEMITLHDYIYEYRKGIYIPEYFCETIKAIFKLRVRLGGENLLPQFTEYFRQNKSLRYILAACVDFLEMSELYSYPSSDIKAFANTVTEPAMLAITMIYNEEMKRFSRRTKDIVIAFS